MTTTTLTSRQEVRPNAVVTSQPKATLRPASRLTGVEQSPLRRRIQDTIDRRFFRKKYDSQQVLAQFAQTARNDVDMDKLTAALLGVVQETLQPEKVSLWLVKEKQPVKRET